MKKLLYFLGFCLVSINSFSSNNNTSNFDSLLQGIRLSQNRVSSVNVFNKQISAVFKNGMPSEKDSFLLFIQTTIEFAKILNDKDGLAEAFYNLGKFFISADQGLAKAIPPLLESLSLFEELNDNTGVSKCYMQIGLISYITKYFEDAIKNFNLSLQYSDNPTSTYLMAISYSEMNNFSESKKYFSIAIRDFIEKNSTSGLNESYMYLGRLYENEGNLDSAFYYLNMSIENLKRNENYNNLTRPYALISFSYLKANDLDKAIYYAQTSYDLSKDGKDNLSAMLAAECLRKTYERKGDFKNAYHYLNLHHALQNENIKGNTKQKIAEIQSTFGFNKKITDEKLRHQEELHKKNRTKNIILSSGLFMLLIAGGLYSRLNFIRKSRAEIKREKDISEGLLLNILPEEVADELKQKGYTDAKEFEKATILFTDFKGFTSMSEKMNASDLVHEIDTCFKAFDDIIGKYGLEKIKTIGDAYMAAGGLPVVDSCPPENVVKAGLEMQDFIIQRHEKHLELGIPSFEMRVGIHTGPVIAGVVGLKKFQYDIWGDTVNTASRMESSGEVGKVNISKSTYEMINNEPEFSFEQREKINVKGKGEMEMYFVNYT